MRRIAGRGEIEDETVGRLIAGRRKMADGTGKGVLQDKEDDGRDWRRRIAGRRKMADQTGERRIAGQKKMCFITASQWLDRTKSSIAVSDAGRLCDNSSRPDD